MSSCVYIYIYLSIRICMHIESHNPALPKDRFTESVVTKDSLTKRLQFTHVTRNYGKHPEPYFHGRFTAFSLTFYGLLTAFSRLS